MGLLFCMVVIKNLNYNIKLNTYLKMEEIDLSKELQEFYEKNKDNKLIRNYEETLDQVKGGFLRRNLLKIKVIGDGIKSDEVIFNSVFNNKDFVFSFKSHFNKICNYTKFEDKRKFLNDYIDKIGVEWDKKSNTHNIKINFKLNIVKDKGELVSNDIYKIIKGKNDLDINGVNVRKFNNYINKKRQNKTYLLDYSTVTDFAKFRG